MKRTKIIATIGPASEKEDILSDLMDAGANVFRFNMKHGEIEWHNKVIKRAQKIANEKNSPIGIMVDLQGPEIRIKTKEESLPVKEGEKIYFGTIFSKKMKSIKVEDEGIIDLLDPDDKILIDDGFYTFVVLKKENGGVIAKSTRNGTIKNRKGLNLPSKKLKLPSLIEDDLKKLELAAKREIDYIALSFTRTAEDIEILKKEMKKRDISAHIIAKIENSSALQNLDEIIETADGIMVARGDLGVETPLEGIPYWQKEIIQRCRERKTPVIVATQMLQSMTENPLPTRAEVTDVANAIFNGTDSVMLSNETAMGKYPVESLKSMQRIIKYNEQGDDLIPMKFTAANASDLLMKAAVDILKNPGEVSFDAILVFTKDGETAKQVSAFRPNLPIFAITNKKEIIERLSICYGVIEEYTVFNKETLKKPNEIIQKLKKRELLEKGKKILLVQAQRWELPELSDALTIVSV